MSSHPQSVPSGRRAVDTRHLPNPATLPLQLQRAHTEVGLVDYHSHHARDYSPHLGQPHRRRPSLLSEFQPGNERGQEQHIRYEHIYLPEPSGQPEVEYAEIKRPRLEITPEALMRPSSHRQPLSLGPAEDIAKSLPGLVCILLWPPQATLFTYPSLTPEWRKHRFTDTSGSKR